MNYTGLSEAKVNELMAVFGNDANNVLTVLTDNFNNILTKLGENWGTNDSIDYVAQNVIPAFTKTTSQIADIIKNIGKTVKTTAMQQALDTKNTITVGDASINGVYTMTNKQQPVLSNGFVGVYSELGSQVTAASEQLKEATNTALQQLKDNIVSNSSSAFTDEGSSQVASQVSEAIASIMATINTSLTSLATDIDTFTGNATKYVKSIQAAGLRSASN